MTTARIKGFADMFPPESETFTRMENTARDVFSRYGFVELRTPLLEFTELFHRSIGEETDVVRKEMYTFPDRKGRSLTLRPEATAGVMRAFVDRGLGGGQGVTRLFTTGPMFRYERPQKGRMRQFHQINCECLGSHSPLADAELVSMLLAYLARLGLKDLSLHINSLGCAVCRPKFKEALLAYLAGVKPDVLCEDCARRARSNPLRVLDCKQPGCRQATAEAPRLLDHVCPECREHFATVVRLLEGEGIRCDIDNRLVRGLDYYCRTTFEVISGGIGAQAAVAGGGRYDGLVRSLGGPDVPGVGFACGMERLALLLATPPEHIPDFYLVAMDAQCREQAWRLAQRLRAEGLCGEMSFAESGVKSLMRQAGKSGARYCLILGESELAANEVVIKNMKSGEQRTVPQAGAAHAIQTGTEHE